MKKANKKVVIFSLIVVIMQLCIILLMSFKDHMSKNTLSAALVGFGVIIFITLILFIISVFKTNNV